jgi:hypothetical protein
MLASHGCEGAKPCFGREIGAALLVCTDTGAQAPGRRIVFEAFVEEFDWEHERRNRNLRQPLWRGGVPGRRLPARRQIKGSFEKRPEITARSIMNAAEKSITSHVLVRDFSCGRTSAQSVHDWSYDDLSQRRRPLTGASRVHALDRAHASVNSEAVEQVLESCRIATSQQGEAFQAEQGQHFVNGGVTGGDVANGVIVSLQTREEVGGGRDLRRRHRSARLGEIGGRFLPLRHGHDHIMRPRGARSIDPDHSGEG